MRYGYQDRVYNHNFIEHFAIVHREPQAAIKHEASAQSKTHVEETR